MSSKRTQQALARLADLTPRQIVAELDRPIDYPPVDGGGPARAAAILAELL